MSTLPQTIDQALDSYEGLIFQTSVLLRAAGVEMDFDDIRQFLRIKTWNALLKYDAGHRSQMVRDRFVFMCITNAKKDLLKRPRRFLASIDEERGRGPWKHTTDNDMGEWFDNRYLSVDADTVYFEVEDEPVVLPSTMDRAERRAVELLLADPDLTLLQLERALGLSRAAREDLMRSIRMKLADWRPTRGRVPTPPLPRAGRRAHDARGPRSDAPAAPARR